MGVRLRCAGAVTMDNNVVSNNCSNGGDLNTGISDTGSNGYAGVNAGGVLAGTVVPEPSTIVLIAVDLLLVGGVRRKTKARLV